MATSFINEGFTSLTPYLWVDDAAAALAFYKQVFDAEERLIMPGEDGSVLHAEIDIYGSVLMLADANEEWDIKSPQSLGGTPVHIFLYAPDVDGVIGKAVANGAAQTGEIEDMFWGDRMGKMTDPFGHQWSVSTHVEDVSPEEMEKRQKAWAEELAGE